MRYVFRCQEENPDSSDLRLIARTPGVKILNDSVPGAWLVEASEEAAALLRSNLKKWIIAEEVIYPSPSHSFKTTRNEKKRK